ncbi:MAG: hypothetical protein GQ552_03415 [Flavobacteriaceae bacterium]|nr:hypothetical protein [Flavobacteriaceae bacterium]
MLGSYSDDLASGLKDFDESYAIYNDLEEYIAAVRYDLADEIFDVNYSHDDYLL